MAKSTEATEAAPEKRRGGAEKGRSKHRSPNYPLYDLKKAVEQTKVLYDSDKTHKIPIEVVHDRWGYASGGAAGNQAVAAVKSYGLIDVEGNGDSRQISVSDAGRRIVLESPERANLLKTAALGPTLFSGLWEQYGKIGVPKKDVIRHHLVFQLNFNEDFVDNAIDRFLSTVDFAKLGSGDTIEPSSGGEEDDGNDVKKTVDPPPADKPKRRRPMESGMKEDVFSLDEGAVILQWPERLSPESVADLEDWLKLMGRKIKRSVNSVDAAPRNSGIRLEDLNLDPENDESD